MASELKLRVENESDIVAARQRGRELAASIGFSATEQTLIATAISEIARNIIAYAKRGDVALDIVEQPGRRGVRVVASDEGPGIENLELAMRDGYSTGRSLGMGLPGAKRLMDEFHIASAPGKGTTVTMKKWRGP